MKRRNINIIYTLFASATVLLAACHKQEPPSGSLQIFQTDDFDRGDFSKPLADGEKIYTNVVMAFVVKDGDGDVYSLWTGEKNSDYREEFRRVSEGQAQDTNHVELNSKGFAMTKTDDRFVCKAYYGDPGEYTATLVGRNIYDKGTSYEQMTHTKSNIVVVDSTAILFHPDASKTDYRFTFSVPTSIYTRYAQLSGFKIQPYFKKAQYDANRAAVKMYIQAGVASIWYNGAELPKHDRGYYVWEVDLTKEQKLTVKARSEGFERTYTVLPVLEWK